MQSAVPRREASLQQPRLRGTAPGAWWVVEHRPGQVEHRPCALAVRMASSLLGCTNGDAAFGMREEIISYFSALVRPYLNSAANFRPTSTRKRLTNWSEFSRGPQAGGGLGTCPVRRDWRTWACSAWSKHSLWGGTYEYLSVPISTYEGVSKKMESGSSQQSMEREEEATDINWNKSCSDWI